MSAARYAARKSLDVGLVAQKIGGQMIYTAHIENYLGFPGVDGSELLERFQFHMESYPLSELLDTQVTAVRKAGKEFSVHTSDGAKFQARTVIYCAGKEYSRLGVPRSGSSGTASRSVPPATRRSTPAGPWQWWVGATRRSPPCGTC